MLSVSSYKNEFLPKIDKKSKKSDDSILQRKILCFPPPIICLNENLNFIFQKKK